MLIVEDEPYLAEAIRDGLRLEAIAADIAGDGDTALELLSINAYDIAVLDRDIPGPTGDEIAKGIVASGSGMPILMLTAADRLDDKATGFELGTNGIAMTLTVVVFAKLLELAGVTPRARDVWAVLLVFGTWLLPYGIVSNNHGIAALLTAVLIWQLLLVEWRGATTARAAAIGCATGLLVAIELLPIISLLPLTLIYLATRRDLTRGHWLLIVSGISVPLVIEAALNVRVTGDIIPAGFHHELFNYPGSVFDDTSLTGNLKFESLGALASYAWTALFAGKGFFTFAPLPLLGLAAGLIEWRWWSRARGVQLLLIAAIVLSLAAALATTNNYGGEAVGFRHAVFLTPALVTLLLPWICEPVRFRRYATIAVAGASVMLMLIFAVRQPWSVLSVSSAPIGKWDEYVPIVARIVYGDLLSP